MERTDFNNTIKHLDSKWPHTGAIFFDDCGCGDAKDRTAKYLPNGMSVVEYLYRTLKYVCKDVVVVGNAASIPDELSHLKQISINFDRVGPIGGLEALLSSGLDSEYLITPSEVGLVDSKLYQLLTQPHIQSPAILASPQVSPGENKPFPQSIEIIDYPQIGRYSTDSLMSLREQIIGQNFCMHRLAQRLDAVKLIIPEDLTYALASSDSPHEHDVLCNLN